MLGLGSLLVQKSLSINLLVFATLLGSSAAITLGSSGQIQPAHLMLGFTTCCIVVQPFVFSKIISSVKFPSAGFWLAWFTGFGILSAYFFPRLFEGATYINAVGSTETGPSILLTPLAPVGGNITQSIYLIADFVCFLIFAAVCRSYEGMHIVAKSIISFAICNILFGLLDLLTYYSNTAFIMEPIRNAQYTLHLDEETAGLKRIAGSFTETSSFSYATVGALGFTLTLWLRGRWVSITGTLSAISLIFLILSTSSTAIAATPFVILSVYMSAIAELRKPLPNRRAAIYVIVLPSIVIISVFLIVLNQAALNVVTDFLNILIFEKANSQSGLERASWNSAAISNFFDTGFLGTGLGSVRASSFPVAVIANVGLIGGFFMSLFLMCIIFSRLNQSSTGIGTDFSVSARNACFGLLFASTVSGSLVDLGLDFYIFAAMACSRLPENSD